MKEIVFATLAIVMIAVVAAFALEAMNWSAAGTFSSNSVRL